MTTLEIKHNFTLQFSLGKKDSFHTVSIIYGFIVLSRNSFTAITKEENSINKDIEEWCQCLKKFWKNQQSEKMVGLFTIGF